MHAFESPRTTPRSLPDRELTLILAADLAGQKDIYIMVCAVEKVDVDMAAIAASIARLGGNPLTEPWNTTMDPSSLPRERAPPNQAGPTSRANPGEPTHTEAWQCQYPADERAAGRRAAQSIRSQRTQARHERQAHR